MPRCPPRPLRADQKLKWRGRAPEFRARTNCPKCHDSPWIARGKMNCACCRVKRNSLTVFMLWQILEIPFNLSAEKLMTDSRYKKLAELLVNYSTQIKKGDRALLDMIDVPDEFTVELVRAVRAAGGTPLVEVRHTRVSRELLLVMNDAHAALVRDIELSRMKKVQAYIAIRGSANASENADVPSERM